MQVGSQLQGVLQPNALCVVKEETVRNLVCCNRK